MTDSEYTHLALVLDRSGSMATRDLYKEMNAGIAQLLADQDKEPGTLLVDVTTFDTVVETPYQNSPARLIGQDLIHPRGGTALRDAVGKTITALGERFAAMPEVARPGKVIVVIVTDGDENSSREWSQDSIKKLVETQQSEFSWLFMFLGANVDAFAAAEDLGVGRGQTMAYAATAGGVQGMSAGLSANTSTYRSSGIARGFTQEQRDAAELV